MREYNITEGQKHLYPIDSSSVSLYLDRNMPLDLSLFSNFHRIFRFCECEGEFVLVPL